MKIKHSNNKEISKNEVEKNEVLEILFDGVLDIFPYSGVLGWWIFGQRDFGCFSFWRSFEMAGLWVEKLQFKAIKCLDLANKNMLQITVPNIPQRGKGKKKQKMKQQDDPL